MFYFVAGFFLAVGLFMVFTGIFDLPGGRIIRVQNRLSRRIAAWNKSKLDVRLEFLAEKLSKRIRLASYRKETLNEVLSSAGAGIEAEMFVSNCLIKAFLVAVLAIPMAFLFPLAVPLILATAYVVYEASFQKPYSIVNKRRLEIEADLPGFVNHISKILKHSRDVLYIIRSYSEYSGGSFAKELTVTEADMRSGNYETALTRLESRVCSSMLSDVTRGLISIIRGDETGEYWKSLEVKFSDYRKQLLRQKALKVPSKVRRLSMALMFCFMLIYLVVLGTVLISSLSAFI